MVEGIEDDLQNVISTARASDEKYTNKTTT
jgi:hypothetical protein